MAQEHDRVIQTREQHYINPVGVAYQGNLIILIQGASRITLDRSMLTQLCEPRTKSAD